MGGHIVEECFHTVSAKPLIKVTIMFKASGENSEEELGDQRINGGQGSRLLEACKSLCKLWFLF